MALPKITNNSPVAGSIAWTATNLSFGTTNFAVPAGSSSKKFVWWEYRNGAPALLDGDTLPELAPEDMLLFLNKNGVGALVPMTDVIDGSLIVSGSVMAAAIAADQIQTYHINADAVTANEIAAGAVAAEHIAAGTITTDKLAVGSVGDNLVTNGSFEEFANGMPIGWRAIATANGGAIDIVTGVASSGTNAARLIATGTTSNARMEQTPDRFIPVSSASGRKWYISARMGAGTAISSGVWLRANWYDGNKTLVSSSDVRSNGSITTSFAVYEGQVTPPSTAKYMSVAVFLYNPSNATNLYVDEVIAREVVMSAQIGDGQITTAKLVANAVTANQIAAGAVTASKLLVGDFENLATINELHGITVTSYGQTQIVGGYNSLVTDSGTFFMFKDQAGPVPFKNTEELYYSFTAKATAATTAQFGIWIYNAAGGNKSVTSSSLNIGTADTPISGSITVPTADATFGPAKQWVCGLQGVANKGIQIKDVVVRRRNGGELIVDGAVYADKLAANAVTSDKIAANAVTANKILAGAIGTDHMVANSIHADRLLANTIGADKLMANSVTAGKLESELVLASKIIAGNPTATHAEMSPEGFRVFADDPTDGIPNEVVRLGVAGTNDYFAITKADGSLAASISQDGVGSFGQVNANSSLYYKGNELQTILDNRGKGILGAAYRYNFSANNAWIGGPFMPYLRLEVDMEPYRLYKIWSSNVRAGIDPNVGGTVAIAYEFDNYATAASPILTKAQHPPTHAGGTLNFGGLQELFAFSGTGTRRVSFMIMFGIQETAAGAGGGQFGLRGDITAPVRLVVEDVGPTAASIGNGVHVDGPAGSGATAPPPPPAVQTYVKQYGAWNSANYNGGNGRYTYNDNVMYQGLSPAGYGNLKSLSLHGDMTADLSGASINYVRVYFNFQHWYYNSGGTARIGVHGHTGIPGTYSSVGPVVAVSGGWPKPGARWVDIPSGYWDGFKTGQWRGVTLEGDGTYGTYGYADRPTIEISYNK